jgi:hypothetical protein
MENGFVLTVGQLRLPYDLDRVLVVSLIVNVVVLMKNLELRR